jgi:hypothetical protein
VARCFAVAFPVVMVVDRNDCSADIDGDTCFSTGSNLGSKNVRATPMIIPTSPKPMENFVSLICFFTIASLKSLCTLNTRIRHSFSASISYCGAAPLASVCHLASSWSVKTVRSSVSSIYFPFANVELRRGKCASVFPSRSPATCYTQSHIKISSIFILFLGAGSSSG